MIEAGCVDGGISMEAAGGAGGGAAGGATAAGNSAVLPSGRCSHRWPHLPHFTFRPEGASLASSTSNRVAQLGQEAIIARDNPYAALPAL